MRNAKAKGRTPTIVSMRMSRRALLNNTSIMFHCLVYVFTGVHSIHSLFPRWSKLRLAACSSSAETDRQNRSSLDT